MKSLLLASLCLLATLAAAQQPGNFRFAIVGDRTGEHVDQVYEKVWQQLAAENPAFVLSVGDTIEGLNDGTAEAEWTGIEKVLSRWKQFPLYLAPGNHDIWSAASAQLYTKHAGHPLHYSFDYGPAHFTVLDNSRSDEIPPAELTFLEADLVEHAKQPLKFVVSHRPSWILKTMLDDPDFELHRIAKKHGVGWVIAGHVHELLHAELDGVTYLSVESAGGHLRGAGRYEDGWFFGYTIVDVQNSKPVFRIHDLNGRTTSLDEWGKAGLKQPGRP